jgi:hypothetical protein
MLCFPADCRAGGQLYNALPPKEWSRRHCPRVRREKRKSHSHVLMSSCRNPNPFRHLVTRWQSHQRYFSLRFSRMPTHDRHQNSFLPSTMRWSQRPPSNTRSFPLSTNAMEPGPRPLVRHSTGGCPIRRPWCESFSLVMGGIPSCELPSHDAATRDFGIMAASDPVPGSPGAPSLALPPCRPSAGKAEAGATTKTPGFRPFFSRFGPQCLAHPQLPAATLETVPACYAGTTNR